MVIIGGKEVSRGFALCLRSLGEKYEKRRASSIKSLKWEEIGTSDVYAMMLETS